MGPLPENVFQEPRGGQAEEDTQQHAHHCQQAELGNGLQASAGTTHSVSIAYSSQMLL
jgi:hypothetical protein